MKHKPKADSVKVMSINATAVSIPKKALLEKLGFNGREKSLQEVLVLYDEYGESIIGLQFNFMNTQQSGEVEREVFINPFKPKLDRKDSLIQKSGVRK